jgi:hypothetical protein
MVSVVFAGHYPGDSLGSLLRGRDGRPGKVETMTKLDNAIAKLAAAETRHTQGDPDAYQEILFWQSYVRELQPAGQRNRR